MLCVCVCVLSSCMYLWRHLSTYTLTLNSLTNAHVCLHSASHSLPYPCVQVIWRHLCQSVESFVSLSHTHSHRNTAPHKHTPLHACDTSAIDRNCFAFLHSEGSGGCCGEAEEGFRDGRDHFVHSSVPAVFFVRWGGGHGHSEHIQGFILHVFAEALRHKRGGRGGRGGGAHRAHTETCSNACACTHSYVTNRHSFSQVSLKFRMSLYCI